MADANFTLANPASSNACDFVSIPPYFSRKEKKQFSKYIPIVLLDCEDDNLLGLGQGRALNLKPVRNEKDAIEVARLACLSTPGAIGYAARGIDHE